MTDQVDTGDNWSGNGDVNHVNEAYYDSDIPQDMPEIHNFIHDDNYIEHDPAAVS